MGNTTRTTTMTRTRIKAIIKTIATKMEKTVKRIQLTGKQIVTILLCIFILFLLLDSLSSDPENRIFNEKACGKFLSWVQDHPTKGLLAFLFVIAGCVIVMFPIGTPLTL